LTDSGSIHAVDVPAFPKTNSLPVSVVNIVCHRINLNITLRWQQIKAYGMAAWRISAVLSQNMHCFAIFVSYHIPILAKL
jgi:hypothetical protein